MSKNLNGGEKMIIINSLVEWIIRNNADINKYNPLILKIINKDKMLEDFYWNIIKDYLQKEIQEIA